MQRAAALGHSPYGGGGMVRHPLDDYSEMDGSCAGRGCAEEEEKGFYQRDAHPGGTICALLLLGVCHMPWKREMYP